MKRCCHHNLQQQISFLSLLLHTSSAFVKSETRLLIFKKNVSFYSYENVLCRKQDGLPNIKKSNLV